MPTALPRATALAAERGKPWEARAGAKTDEIIDQGGFHGPREVEALAAVGPELTYLLVLPRILDPLGDNRHL